MPTWLTVVLGILVGGWLLLLTLFLVLRFFLRRFVARLQSGSAVPARVTLVPCEEVDWGDPEAVERHLEDLRGAGFQEGGLFQIEEIPGVNLAGFAHPDHRVWAAVYEHPAAGTIVDVVSAYEDQRSLTVTSTSQGEGLAQRPGHQKIRLEGQGVPVLLDRLLAERPEGPLQEVAPSGFKAHFERAYAEEMDWRNSRGGPSEEEIRAVARASGKEPSEDQIQLTRKIQQEQARRGLEEAARRDAES
jgi:hypothetical protein